jgi:hypothetical protein
MPDQYPVALENWLCPDCDGELCATATRAENGELWPVGEMKCPGCGQLFDERRAVRVLHRYWGDDVWAEPYELTDEDYALLYEEHSNLVMDHVDDAALMWFCEPCQRWHVTRAGDRMDQLYADVLRKEPYVYYPPGYLPF